MKTCIYLRKSRADEELEREGHGSTLNRHKETLIKEACTRNLDVVKIHEEIVSGDSVYQRPKMLQLLQEVSANIYDAVLCMDIDRLGRGNMQEQGLILDTFKNSNTKIITPRKIYDLNDEFDEEYSEFEAFMARKELKIITRRMQRGRLKSVEEGNYIGTYAPFGYKTVGQGRNRQLVIDEDAAPIIKLIFDMYSKGNGGTNIAHKLNSMGYKTSTGRDFYGHSIINIIKNPIYTGKVTWKKKEYIKGNLEKKKSVKLNKKEDWIIKEGKHKPLVSQELYDTCQFQLNNKTHAPYNKYITNPLAGLIFCSGCGKPMAYRPYGNKAPHIICYSYCKANKSSRFDYIEAAVLLELEELVKKYEIELPSINDDDADDVSKFAIKNINREMDKLNKQKSSLHDLLEQGIYDIDTFLERTELLQNKLLLLDGQLKELSVPKKNTITASYLNELKNVIDIYKLSNDAQLKNQLLKTYIKEIVYSKPKESRDPKGFKLAIKLNF